jgi:hypothetical protein
VIDETNGKLIGLIGLGDPVYALRERDDWIGWDDSNRKLRLKNCMDAFVLGAVPPYSQLLCGKLVAMLATSKTVSKAFRNKYRGRKSVISNETHDGRLALITTTSALGRSSVYNRIKFRERILFHGIGYTKGTGEFQFSNGLYKAMSQYANENCEATLRKEQWGSGFRNRRELVKKALTALGYSTQWINHGIKREIFAVPLATNTRDFLRGDHSRLKWTLHDEDEIFAEFKSRWLMPRLKWDERYKAWQKDSWLIWNE